VVGALLGKQEGRVTEIVNTVEFAYKEIPVKEGGIAIEEAFCQGRLDAYAKLFPDLQCIGWYSAATDYKQDTPAESDYLVHKKMNRFAENPLFMLMNPESKEAHSKKQVPLFLYEMKGLPDGKFF